MKVLFLQSVSPPFLRLGARQPGATLERRMLRERPPTQSVHTAIMESKATCSSVLEEVIADRRMQSAGL